MSGTKTNHYQTLGVTSNVTSAEIKQAYRQLAKAQHPDTAHGHEESEAKKAATEEMMRINEAYATLNDVVRRAEYDVKIGVKKMIYIQPVFSSLDEDQERQRFLRTILHPMRNSILKVLSAYKKELQDLSADPYDDRLLDKFQSYVNKIEDTLRAGADALSVNVTPRTLEPSVHMMKYAIARAADALEELHYYCMNYDYKHLTMAENLFRITKDLLNQSQDLTKV